MDRCLRTCWLNCCEPHDERVLADDEVAAVDELEDQLSPLDSVAVSIREMISRYEVCYHEADREAGRIVRAIGAWRRPRISRVRPAKRRRALENTRRILERQGLSSFLWTIASIIPCSRRNSDR